MSLREYLNFGSSVWRNGILKLDMAETYDSVSRDYLYRPQKWIGMIWRVMVYNG